MRAIITVKHVIDPQAKIRLGENNREIETEHVRYCVNPFDEIALEEAQRLKERNVLTETLAISVGPERCKEALRTALAMGADRALHILIDSPVDQHMVARILARSVRQYAPDLVLMGKQSIDRDAHQTGQMLAGLLDWPQVTALSALTYQGGGVWRATREVDEGTLTVEVSAPFVGTVDLRLNAPRFIALPKLMQAKRKPIETQRAEDLVEIGAPLTKVECLDLPIMERKRIMLDQDDALVETVLSLARASS